MDIAKLDFDRIYASIQAECGEIFRRKLEDYGPTWLYYRDISLVDQLWIKVRRIRTLEEAGGATAVGEGREGEYIGLVNYAAIMLMKLRHPEVFPDAGRVVENSDLAAALDTDQAASCFDAALREITALMKKKNQDYGCAWAEMDIRSITDQIIIKLARIRNILANGGRVQISENIDAQLMDVANYSIFGLIKLRAGEDGRYAAGR